MFCGGKREGGGLGIDIDSFAFVAVGVVREGSDELVPAPFVWTFLLKEGLQLVLGVVGCIFLHVDGVLQNFGVVHGAPADETAMVGEGWELVALDVAMYGLLDVEVLAHMYNFNKFIDLAYN
jgi:hypothetical protein